MNKLFDEKGRLFGKISVIDILAVALCLVLAFAVVRRFVHISEVNADNSRPRTLENGVTVDLTFNIQSVRSYTADAISEGDMLYDTATGKEIGVITEKTVIPAQSESTLADGSMRLVTVPERYNVLIKVRTQGEVRNGTFYTADNFRASLNSNVGFFTKLVLTSGTVWEIERA